MPEETPDELAAALRLPPAAAPDRYITFKDIDCDGNARRIMDCIAHHIALPERNNAFWEYFMKNAKAAPAPPG